MNNFHIVAGSCVGYTYTVYYSESQCMIESMESTILSNILKKKKKNIQNIILYFSYFIILYSHYYI